MTSRAVLLEELIDARTNGMSKQRATMRGARLGAKLGFTFEAQNWFQFSLIVKDSFCTVIG